HQKGRSREYYRLAVTSDASRISDFAGHTHRCSPGQRQLTIVVSYCASRCCKFSTRLHCRLQQAQFSLAQPASRHHTLYEKGEGRGGVMVACNWVNWPKQFAHALTVFCSIGLPGCAQITVLSDQAPPRSEWKFGVLAIDLSPSDNN